MQARVVGLYRSTSVCLRGAAAWKAARSRPASVVERHFRLSCHLTVVSSRSFTFGAGAVLVGMGGLVMAVPEEEENVYRRYLNANFSTERDRTHAVLGIERGFELAAQKIRRLRVLLGTLTLGVGVLSGVGMLTGDPRTGAEQARAFSAYLANTVVYTGWGWGSCSSPGTRSGPPGSRRPASGRAGGDRWSVGPRRPPPEATARGCGRSAPPTRARWRATPGRAAIRNRGPGCRPGRSPGTPSVLQPPRGRARRGRAETAPTARLRGVRVSLRSRAPAAPRPRWRARNRCWFAQKLNII